VKSFDHSKTKFPLLAARNRGVCSKCHAGERYAGLATTGVSWHSLQDKHAARNGSNCESCHAPTKWTTVSFDHNKAPRFALRGGDAKLACERCHTSNARRDRLAADCVTCKDDFHTGQLGAACEQCHKETSWRQTVAFDHNLTRLPLIGLHATLPCEHCLRSPSCKDASRTCAGRRHQDVHHAGRLGSNCASCHNPNGWFDHDQQTRYPQTRAYRALTCHACHKTTKVAKASAPTECHACHSQDDRLDGAFGRACEKCHTTVSFSQGLGRQ
jgi:hypothetical protein